MSRTIILALSILAVVGCGNSEAPKPTNEGANTIDSVTYVRPTEEKIGKVTMADFSSQSGLKVYPGSESTEGELFSHGDGVVKNVMVFSTKDTVEKIADFYKAEGFDTANKTKIMGMTKKQAQAIIDVTPSKEGANEVKITCLMAVKK